MFGMGDAFDAYAVHQTELERIVREIAAGATTVDYVDDLSANDLNYIKNRLYADYGYSVDFN